MPTQQELESAAKLLAASMTPNEAAALVSANHNVYLKQQEDAKVYPLASFTMPDADWQAMKAHLMDGGGAVEDADLAVEIMTALLKDDQKTFWRGLVHLYKFWMKVRGHQVSAPGGGVFFSGVSADPTAAP